MSPHSATSSPLRIQQDAFLTWSQATGHADQTVVIRRFALNQFISWCAATGIDSPAQVGRETLEQYQTHLAFRRKANGDRLAINTQIARLNPLRAFFKWLARNGDIANNPAADLCVPRVARKLPTRVPSIAEVWRILARPDVATPGGIRDRAALELLYATGIRRMELVQMAVDDLDLEGNAAIVRSGKGNRDRVVPIGLRATRWLLRYLDEVRPSLAAGDSEFLFLNNAGEPYLKNRLGDLVRKYIVRAGIRSRGACHLFRHACATHMLENGADIRYIQALLGHADLSTTQIYTHVSIAKLKSVHAMTHPSARNPTSGAPNRRGSLV